MATRSWPAVLALMLAITVVVAVPLDTQAQMRGAMGGGGVRQGARGPANPGTMMGSGGMGTSGRMGPGTMTPPAQMGPANMGHTGAMGPQNMGSSGPGSPGSMGYGSRPGQ